MSYLAYARFCAVVSPCAAFLVVISLPVIPKDSLFMAGMLMYGLGAMFVMALQLSVNRSHAASGTPK